MYKNWYDKPIDVPKLFETITKILGTVGYNKKHTKKQFTDWIDVLDFINTQYNTKHEHCILNLQERERTLRVQLRDALNQDSRLMSILEERDMTKFFEKFKDSIKGLKDKIHELEKKVEIMQEELNRLRGGDRTNDIDGDLSLRLGKQSGNDQSKNNQNHFLPIKQNILLDPLTPLDHYDTVIKAKTFKDLIYSGWTIYKAQNINLNIPQCSVITVIGNVSKGKSFIVKYLSGQGLAIGHNIHTEGPSCIYPRDRNNPVTFLDTAGFGEPLRVNTEQEKLKKFYRMNHQIEDKNKAEAENKAEEENNKTEIENLDKKKEKNDEDLHQFIHIYSDNDEKKKEKENEEEKEEKKHKRNENIDHSIHVYLDSDTEILTSLLKDKQYIEDFLQRFLLETSNFILIVVSQMAFPDQKLIKRILNQYLGKKKIFIIHNYYNLETIKDVEYAIKYDILDVFEVKKVIIPSFGIENTNTNREYYISKQCESDLADFAHVVMAREGTEAGDYYNEPAKELILAMVKTCNQKFFVLEKALSEYIKENLMNYLDNITSSECIIENIQNEEDLSIVTEKASSLSPVGLLKLKSKEKKLEFKRMAFDDFGFLKFSRATNEKISLPYKLIENPTNIQLIIEIPGLHKDYIQKTFNVTDLYSTEGFYFQINGKKQELLKINDPLSKVTHTNISFGDIDFHTIIAGKQEQIKDMVNIEEPEMSYENGLLMYIWKKKEKKKAMRPVLISKKN